MLSKSAVRDLGAADTRDECIATQRDLSRQAEASWAQKKTQSPAAGEE